MPKTLRYRPILIDQLITNERINSYQSVFQPSNDIELMGVYLWNAHVCGVIYPIIGMAEITLRNAIDQALQVHLGNFWWRNSSLRYRSFKPGALPPKAVQAVRDNFKRATNKFITTKRHRYNITGHVSLNHSGIVAQTEFSTWEYMLDHEFMGNKLIWPSRLGTVFAGPWPSTHAGIVLTHASDLVSTVREFRNRLSHHEPAWKRFGIVKEADALLHLQEKITKIENLIALIHPENIKLIERNGLLEMARRACTSQEIRRFQHMTETYKVNSMDKLQILVDRCRTENSILRAELDLGAQQMFLISPC